MFTNNGFQIIPLKEGVDDRSERDKAEGAHGSQQFGGRIPFVHQPATRRIFMGGPNWFHADTMKHHGLDYWSDDLVKGYVGGNGGYWNKGIQWYGQPDADAEQALIEGGYHTPEPEVEPPAWDDDDLWGDDD